MASNLSNYVKGVGSGYVKTLVTMLVSLWMVPFTLQFLSKAEYGVFAIAGDILLWLGLLQLGTGASLSSRAAQMLGRKDSQSMSELASTALVMQLIAAFLVAVVGGVITLNIENVFPGGAGIEGLQTAFFLLVLGASFQISAQVFSGLLIANKQIHVDNLLSIGLFLLQTAITVTLLKIGFKLMALAVASLVSIAIVSCLAYWRVRKGMPDITISFAKFRMKHVRDLFGNGIWFTVGGLAGILIMNLDRFIVGRYISLAAVTAFVITGKLYFIADKLHGQLFNVMRPYFGQLHGKGESGKLCELYQTAFTGSLLLAGLMAAVIFLLNKWFIGVWVGAEYYQGDLVSLLFAVNFVLQASVLPNRILLASTLYRMKWSNGFRLFEGALNLALSLLLVKIIGIEGVLLGSIIGSAGCSAIAMNYLSRRYFLESVLSPSYSIYLFYAVIPVLFGSYALIPAGFLQSVFPLLTLSLASMFYVMRVKLLRSSLSRFRRGG